MKTNPKVMKRSRNFATSSKFSSLPFYYIYSQPDRVASSKKLKQLKITDFKCTRQRRGLRRFQYFHVLIFPFQLLFFNIDKFSLTW